MKKLLFTPIFILMTIFSFSQEERIYIEIPKVDKNENKDSIIYDVVEVLPEFPGGMGELAKFLQENFIYPEEARANKELFG